MKRIEITYRKDIGELEKLSAKLERAEKALSKKAAVAEKLGVKDWNIEDHTAWIKTVELIDGFRMANESDIRKNGAWFEYIEAVDTVQEIKTRIDKAEKHLQKVETEIDEYRATVAALENLKAKEELQKLDLEQERKEWAKDGITLEDRYFGLTPSGKRFVIYGNNACVECQRGWHCYTLRIDGNVIFTSGEFWRAYAIVKNS